MLKILSRRSQRSKRLKRVPRRRLTNVHHIAKEGFDKEVDAYQSARPDYPLPAIQYIIKETGMNQNSNVLDLAAGTGIFTRIIGSHPQIKGLKLVAVEPSTNMRKKFSSLSKIPIKEGTADKIPFENGTFDVVTVAQAFHWFANRNALQEINRVLKSSGHLVLIWNLENRNYKWVARLRDTYEQYEKDSPQYRHGTWIKVFEEDSKRKDRLFSELKTSKFNNDFKDIPPHIIWERVKSKSYVSILPDKEKKMMKDKVYSIISEELFKGAKIEDLDKGNFKTTYPYDTDVVIAKKI